MDVKTFFVKIKQLGIETLVGVPDSTLKHFCNYANQSGEFLHYTPSNEGAAIGMAIGAYLSSGKPTCVYMQNSGLGNAVNPITSLANKEVYGIPLLLIVGWRGEPGKKDEPQHKFMGQITEGIFDLLEIEHATISKETDVRDLDLIFKKALLCLQKNRQFAILVKKGTFVSIGDFKYTNKYSLVREKAITQILKSTSSEDVIISTTGKISREVYEDESTFHENQGQAFLTVGGMGHASMIALGIACNLTKYRVYCFDGDGAVLMHMGNLAHIAKQNPRNLIHICLNNEAHESVGGMPTCAAGANYSKIAKACGYPNVFRVHTEEDLKEVLSKVKGLNELCFIEILIVLSSRDDLGRPKETATENKTSFMRYHGVIK